MTPEKWRYINMFRYKNIIIMIAILQIPIYASAQVSKNDLKSIIVKYHESARPLSMVFREKIHFEDGTLKRFGIYEGKNGKSVSIPLTETVNSYKIKGINVISTQRPSTHMDRPGFKTSNTVSSRILNRGVPVNTVTSNLGNVKRTLLDERKESQVTDGIFEYSQKIQGYWLDELLSNRNFHIQGEENDEKFGRIVNLLVDKNDKSNSVKIAVSLKYHGMIVHSEEIPDVKAGFLHKKVEDVLKIDQLFLPKSAKVMSYISGKLLLTKVGIVDSCSRSVNDTVFSPELKQGDIVKDISNTYYRIGPNGERIYSGIYNVPGAKKNMLTGWLFVLSMVTIIIMSLFGFIKWQKKRKA
jgi:hypothetical protein